MKIEPALSPANWWQAIGEHQLLVSECVNCRERWLPWEPTCPRCGHGVSVALPVSGRGAVHTWVVIHRSASHSDETPYTVACVELEEGPRVFARLELDDHPIRAGLPVLAAFVERDGRTLLEFVLDVAPR